MKTLIRKNRSALLIAFVVILSFSAGIVGATEATTGGASYTVSEISYTGEDTGNNILTIKGVADQPPTFISYDLFDPLRIVIDIANGGFAEGLTLPIELNSGAVASVLGSTVNDQETVIAKIEVLLTEDNQYSVEKVNNDIQITFAAKDSVSESPSLQEKASGEGAMGMEIMDATIKINDTGVVVTLVAGQPITDYERVVLPKSASKPDRMYLDIHGAKSSIASVIDVDKGSLARLRASTKENGTRIVFDSKIDQLFDYQIETIETGLQISISNPTSVASGDPIGNLISELSDSGKSTASQKNSPISEKKSKAGQRKSPKPKTDLFTNAGYNQDRITVDFYKTNIENVFYLLKELSGRNFVVDDSVSGNVTLYLENVPWDFILDVVLNLKGLQKIEKFNTIVISPQSKNFTWPEVEVAVEDDITMDDPDADIMAQIDAQLSQPPEIIEAKMTIQKANELAAEKQFQAALSAYKKAYVLWPDNIDLIKKISTFCLAEMGNYVCAEDYASKALALDANDEEAALQMAITRANMGKDDAGSFFEKAAQGERPTQAALLNYAAYLENKGENSKALTVLDKFEAIYERTFNSMVAKARIFDKENQPEKAEEVYESILMYTGFDLPPDLEKFIKGRLALRDAQH